MDNSALSAAIRERLVAELTKSVITKPDNVSIGVITDDCEKENNIVREGILLELAKPNNPSRRDVKDASIQTDKEESAARTHVENNTPFERRIMEIELECEQRLRREMNAKLRLSAKQQAMQAMQRLERKHKDECRLLKKQIVEEQSRWKHREKDLLQVISQQQLSGQKELKQAEQKLERERLEKATLESEMGLLNDRMKELQEMRFSDNENRERALTASMNNLEQQKRQCQKFQLMFARESEKLLETTKHYEQTQKELQKMERKLAKTESAIDAKNSETIALRALLKQCQSALESLSYKNESGHDYIPAATRTPTTQPAYISKSMTPTIQPTVPSLTVQPIQNSIDKESYHQPAETRSSLQDPPCFSLTDPPEDVLPLTQPLVQNGEALDGISVRTIVPTEIELLDSKGNDDGGSIEKSQLPMQLKTVDTSQPAGTEYEPCRSKPEAEAYEHNEIVLDDEGKLSPEQHPSSNVETKTSKTTPRDESASAVCIDESSELKNDISIDSESTDTDEYSMGSFCTVEDHKLDKHGRVSFLHIK